MTHFSVIPRSAGLATTILLVRQKGCWSLPEHQCLSASDINAEVASRFGIRVTTLECMHEFATGPNDEDASRIYLHEPHGPWPDHLPDGTSWLSAPELAQAVLAIPEHRPVLLNWLAEVAAGQTPPERLPWARCGWFAAAAAWATERLAEAGLVTTGQPEQLHTRIWSSLIRIPVASGWVYLKASPPAFSHEATLTESLSRRFPEHLPRVIAADPERNWLLMHDFGPIHETSEPGAVLDGYLQVLPRYARMQLQCAAEPGPDLSHRCPDHRLARLPDHYDALLADDSLLYEGDEGGLERDDRERLAGFSPAFREICAELAASGLPETLVHGDLWRANFALTGPHPVIFDWAETVLTHPFVSLAIPVRDIRSCIDDDGPAVDRARDIYLAEWRAYGSPESLRYLSRLAQVPAIVSRTLLWKAAIAGLEEDRRLFYRYAVPVNLRRLLPLMDEYSQPTQDSGARRGVRA